MNLRKTQGASDAMQMAHYKLTITIIIVVAAVIIIVIHLNCLMFLVTTIIFSGRSSLSEILSFQMPF